jgi:ATP/maltotriose-dependent transcriptional regulator MalT
LSTDERKSDDAAREVGHLYDMAVDWLYERQNPSRARRYTNRLRQLVQTSDPNAESIFTQECLSLAHEADGDLAQAIRHRENEILLIHRLHKLAQGRDKAHADFLLGQYDGADLRDRLYLLATLYRASGNLDQAISSLQECRNLCRERRLKFDWEVTLQNYLVEEQKSRRHS